MTSDSPEEPLNQIDPPTLPVIYILGNSHSGSTLLGFLLSAHPDIVNLGELKGKTWLKDRFCSCGHSVGDCPFYADFFPTFNALKKRVITDIRGTHPIKFFIRKNISLDQTSAHELKAFYTAVSHQVSSTVPNAKFITDTSKSVSLLNAWLNILPREKIKIIYLKRQTEANVASFVKRGIPFFKALTGILINNRMIRRYLKKNKLDYLEVDYNRFHNHYADEAKRMSAYIGVDIPDTDSVPVHHHVIGGNNRTRKSFTNKVTGIHKDEEWHQILTGFQKNLLSLLS
jgi:hypothetical protein